MTKTVSRSEARTAGLLHYFTGKPCPRGHVDERFVSTYGCMTCNRIANKQNSDANPDRVKRDNRLFKELNPDYHLEWRKRNPDRCREIDKRKRLKYADQIRATQKAWRANNKARIALLRRARVARQRGCGGSHTLEDVAEILSRQNWKCASCLSDIMASYHVDHIMPLTLGGSNGPENLQGLCPTCNMQKHNKHPSEWARQNGRLL